MTYVVTEDCIKCKYTDCVEVCPVDCFYEGRDMLVIHPDECIVCGICVPECPIDAIVYIDEAGGGEWAALNAEYAEVWPNISSAIAAPKDAKKFEGVKGKFAKYFDANTSDASDASKG